MYNIDYYWIILLANKWKGNIVNLYVKDPSKARELTE